MPISANQTIEDINYSANQQQLEQIKTKQKLASSRRSNRRGGSKLPFDMSKPLLHYADKQHLLNGFDYSDFMLENTQKSRQSALGSVTHGGGQFDNLKNNLTEEPKCHPNQQRIHKMVHMRLLQKQKAINQWYHQQRTFNSRQSSLSSNNTNENQNSPLSEQRKQTSKLAKIQAIRIMN